MSFIENTRYIIDRFESEGAMLETPDLDIIAVPVEVLPEGAQEGDLLLYSHGCFAVLKSETAERKESVNDLFERLKKRSRDKK